MCDNEPFYRFHLFFCTNQRDNANACSDHGSVEIREHAKRLCAQLGLSTQGGVRINTSGCLGRCEHGPVVAVYPEGTWYTYVDADDVTEIIQEHIVGGRQVERLKI